MADAGKIEAGMIEAGKIEAGMIEAGMAEHPATGPSRFYGATIEALVRCLLEVGSTLRPVAALDPDGLADDIAAVLTHPDFDDLTIELRRRVLLQILLVYSGSWHAGGQRLIVPLQRVHARLYKATPLDIDALCYGYDLLYFLYWCRGGAVAEQQGFADDVVRPMSAALRRQVAAGDDETGDPSLRARPRTIDLPIRVALLCQFVSRGPGNAIAEANRVLVHTLAANRHRYRVSLFAWMMHDPATLAEYEALGVEVHAIVASTPSERIARLEAAFVEVRPDIVITDMNASVPTVLFERGIAPTQVYYQFGMPHWPLASIDGLFHVWDFDLAGAGFDSATSVMMTIPYDLERFAGPVSRHSLDEERARLPAGRLIGTYGRLAKLSPEFIETAVAAVKDQSDVTLVFGGSGDPALAQETIDRLGAGTRAAVVARFVDGHLWGHILEVFLDTFPQPGGASCLEMLAKGKPVVGLRSSDASNLIETQRVDMLSARDARDYAGIVSRLLSDEPFRRRAAESTRALVASYPTLADFALQFDKAIDIVHRRVTPPPPATAPPPPTTRPRLARRIADRIRGR